MRFLSIILFVLFSGTMYGQKLAVVGESSVFVSGDPVRMQMILFNDDGTPIDEPRVITTYLVNHEGIVITLQRFLITPYEKNAVMVLPGKLETGRYKLISVFHGSNLQNELGINIYNPSVFSSTLAPKNADVNSGPLEQELDGIVKMDVRVTAGDDRGSVVIPAMDSESAETGIGLVHVCHDDYCIKPVPGENIAAEGGDIEVSYEIGWLSDEPNSRISFYYLSQGLVEEHYLADGDRIYDALRKHYGGGPVWAYQFDTEGNRLGQVDLKINMSTPPRFAAFDNTVPYNEKVRAILENKRVRKYVDQVYLSEANDMESILEDEFDMSADATVRPDRYEGYATLREALANIVPKTQVIRRSGSYEIRLSPANSGFRYTEKPLVLLNGVPTYDPDSLMDMPFQNLERISIYNSLERLRRFGTLGRFGVVEIDLKSSADNPLDKFRSELPVVRGISDVLISPPDHGSENPDLRSNVAWDASVRLYLSRPNEVSWKMSDLPGIYHVWGIVYLPDGEKRYFDQQFNHLYRK